MSIWSRVKDFFLPQRHERSVVTDWTAPMTPNDLMGKPWPPELQRHVAAVDAAEALEDRLRAHRIAVLNASIVQAIRNKKRHLHLVARRDELVAND